MHPKPCCHGSHGHRYCLLISARKTEAEPGYFVCAMFRADAARPSDALLFANTHDLQATTTNTNADHCMGKDPGDGEVFEGIEGKDRLLLRPPPLVPLWGHVACPSRNRSKSNNFCGHESGSSKVLSNQEQGCVSSKSGSGSGLKTVVGVRHSPRATQQRVGPRSSPDPGPRWSGGGPRPGAEPAVAQLQRWGPVINLWLKSRTQRKGGASHHLQLCSQQLLSALGLTLASAS